MSELSRRQFFKKFAYDLQDQVRLPESATRTPETKVSEWVRVASQAQMSPGTILKTEVNGSKIILNSDDEGVSAARADGTGLALRAGAMGAIEANLSEVWPETRKLSHITGQAIESFTTRKAGGRS